MKQESLEFVRFELHPARGGWANKGDSTQCALFGGGELAWSRFWDAAADFSRHKKRYMAWGRWMRGDIWHRTEVVNVRARSSTEPIDVEQCLRDSRNNPCHIMEIEKMSTLLTDEFKLPIGSPTNQERTYLTGDGKIVGELLVHTLPVYRQKDYPNYKTRKAGPYVVTLMKSGIRISSTAEKLVFAHAKDAIAFAEEVSTLLALYGLPVSTDDPRTVIEKARDMKDQTLPALKELAKRHNASFVAPQQKSE